MPTEWLYDTQHRIQTVNAYGPTNRPEWVSSVDTFFFHWTATPHAGPTSHDGSDRPRQERWLRRIGGSSTGFDILRDGTVIQGSALTHRTWHAGGSKIPLKHEVLSKFNSRSIGIDMDNVGNLYPHGNGFIDYYGRKSFRAGNSPSIYKGPKPYQHTDGKYYEPYTVAQVKSLLKLVSMLGEEFPNMRGARRIDRDIEYGSVTRIVSSVGVDGRNRRADVTLIQDWLGVHPDGFIGPRTITAIRNAQSLFMHRPDGRVDAGGRSEREIRPKSSGVDNRKWLIGHSDVDRYKKGKKLPNKSDPGPHFPWPLVEQVLSIENSGSIGDVNWSTVPGVHIKES